MIYEIDNTSNAINSIKCTECEKMYLQDPKICEIINQFPNKSYQDILKNTDVYIDDAYRVDYSDKELIQTIFGDSLCSDIICLAVIANKLFGIDCNVSSNKIEIPAFFTMICMLYVLNNPNDLSVLTVLNTKYYLYSNCLKFFNIHTSDNSLKNNKLIYLIYNSINLSTPSVSKAKKYFIEYIQEKYNNKFSCDQIEKFVI